MKYYKAEDVHKTILGMWTATFHNTTDTLIGKLESLPTIEVSEDCISREYLEEQLQQIEDITAMAHIDLGEDPYDETEEITMPISTVRKIFKNAPSVISKPKEGEWIKRSSVGNWECSLCGSDVITIGRNSDNNYNYCPNCGAKMKG